VLYPHSLVLYRPFTGMFFSILPKCLFVIIIIYAYFIDISQGSVETHLWCDGIYTIITLSQIVCRVCQWNNFENWSVIGEDMDKSKLARFFLAHPVYKVVVVCLGNVINIQSGKWVGFMSGLGAGLDSFYEYLLKVNFFSLVHSGQSLHCKLHPSHSR